VAVGGVTAVIVAAILIQAALRHSPSSSSSTTSTVPATAVTTTASPIFADPSIATLSHKVPPGDYGPFCAEARRQDKSHNRSTQPSTLAQNYRDVDFTRLRQVAPAGLKPALDVLIRTRGDIAVLIEQLGAASKVDPADLPVGFAQAFLTTNLAYSQKCLGSGPS
jgi:hypothetical protein